MEIKKVVIPAAGWGTRFLPETKSIPKEMLPIIDRPVIEYVVKEAISAGIKDIIIITGFYKRAIEDYFDKSFELEEHLRKSNKLQELKEIQDISRLANFIYIRQKRELYGNGIPVLSAEPAVGNEPFVVMWGDEFIKAEPPRLTQMIEAYKKHPGVVISSLRIPENEVSKYGIVDIEPVEENVSKKKRIVENPSPEEAPSNLAALGAYILPPEIFDIIRHLKPGKNGEIWLTDAINVLIKEHYPVYSCEIKGGKYYDMGNKLSYLKAVIEFVLKRPEFSQSLKDYLKSLNLN